MFTILRCWPFNRHQCTITSSLNLVAVADFATTTTSILDTEEIPGNHLVITSKLFTTTSTYLRIWFSIMAVFRSILRRIYRHCSRSETVGIGRWIRKTDFFLAWNSCLWKFVIFYPSGIQTTVGFRWNLLFLNFFWTFSEFSRNQLFRR
jgi:hypothetical protein